MILRSVSYFLVVSLLLITACSDRKTITVFHAGSLSVPFREMAAEFERLHPDVKVRLEGAGSLTCIRKITELGKPCDVLAVADYTLIDQLMIPEHSSHNIMFAGNEMAIGYLPGSKWEGRLTLANWPRIMMAEDVRFGRSDPDHDPSGYRTEIMIGLAEKKLNIPGLKKKLLEKDRKYIRPKGTELLPLLETGAIDFIFHYRSVIRQHKLGILLLPDSLNLSDPKLTGWYGSVCVDVRGTAADSLITKCGDAMIYGICLPRNGKNPGGAGDFIEFVLTAGKEILERNGQPVLVPAASPGSALAPEWFSLMKL